MREIAIWEKMNEMGQNNTLDKQNGIALKNLI